MTTATNTTRSNPFAALGEALEAAAERFEEGSSSARESAKNAAGTTQRFFKVGLYNTAYGLSYGVVFASVYLTELLPKNGVLRRGLEEGADAAFEAQTKKAAEKPIVEEPVVKRATRATATSKAKKAPRKSTAAKASKPSVDAES